MSFSVVIPSARADNLMTCVCSMLDHDGPRKRIIVVDDGSRGQTESLLPTLRWVTGVKPFVFARNVNLGIVAAGDDDVILLNDDARLLTVDGFGRLEWEMRHHPQVGVCSAGIVGTVNNPNQHTTYPPVMSLPQFRYEYRSLAFVCVYIRREVIEKVGLLDERFVGYGWDDDDYCRRVQDAGWRLGVWDGCIVDHSDDFRSVFRTQPDWQEKSLYNRQLYLEKWMKT